VAYVSLYRKYRSQTFAELLGQDHVTRTLAQSIDEDRISHAYLFTGPRGTGKTSTARILAKSLNCENGPTATPCGKCAHCVAVTEGSSVDVIEIDAASHGGIDDVRDLRDRVAFAPASARKKVYIVDECHMLSTPGWNAFLKTVEEPPDHVIFVFATTEPHKVPDTILSRTQRFDFKRMSAAVLSAHVADVGARESVTFEPGAVDLIVRAGDGSARDTLSVLEQVIAFTGRTVTLRGVVDVLGAVPHELLLETADLIAAGDVAGLCALVGRLGETGVDLRQFARDAVGHLRQLFLIQVAPEAGLVETTDEHLASLQAQAGQLGRTELLRAIELLAECQAQMRRGNTRLPLELALIKAALPEASGDAAALGARLDRLERLAGMTPSAAGAPAAAVATPAAPVESPPAVAPASPPAAAVEAPPAAVEAPPVEAPPVEAPATAVEAPPVPEAPAQDAAMAMPPAETSAADDASATAAPPASETAIDLELIQRSWEAILDGVKTKKRSLQAWLLMSRPVSLRGTTLGLEFRSGYAFHADNCAREDSQALLGDVFEQVLGTRLRVDCKVADGDGRAAPVAADNNASLEEQAEAVAESEAAAASGEVVDEGAVHEQAIQTLTRDLGAIVVDDQDGPSA
jgi:DNA polymerase-3 subunit gamma/tau